MTAIAQRTGQARQRSSPRAGRLLRRALNVVLVLALLAAALSFSAVLVPRALGYGTLAVLSGSMGEAAPTGSLVIGSWRSAGEIGVGDVILARRAGRAPVLHRVISLKRGGGEVVLRLKGDANPAPDPEEYTLPERVMRKDHALPLIGYLVAFLRMPLGWILLVGLPATLIAASVLRDVWRKPETEAASQVVADAAPAAEPAERLGEREAELERRALLLAAGEARIRQREREVAERSAAAVTPPATDPMLERHAAAVADRESELERRLAAVSAAEERLRARERQLGAREAANDRAEAALAAARADITAESQHLAEAQGAAEPPPPPEEAAVHLVFMPGAQGYTLVERAGPAPPLGTLLAGPEGPTFVVTRVARSPLPGDGRRCAYVQLS
jgi:signal peptidase I